MNTKTINYVFQKILLVTFEFLTFEYLHTFFPVGKLYIQFVEKNVIKN